MMLRELAVGFSGCMVGFTIGFLLLSSEKRRLREEAQSAKLMVLAARWLAYWNHGRAVAFLRLAMKRADLTYEQAVAGAGDASRWACTGNLGQLVPLDRVPIRLREAVITHNYDARQHWRPDYAARVGRESEQDARIRQLEDAVALGRATLDAEPSETITSKLARDSSVSYLVMERALTTARAAVLEQMDLVLGTADPEKILPSIY